MNRKTKLALLEMMLRIRKTELRLAEIYRSGDLTGALHLYEGEEAIAAGVCAALNRDDFITSTHRGSGHCVARGMPLRTLIAEVYGKATGCCGGKGGHMHMFDVDAGIMGTTGIVGAGMPLATGLGLSIQLRKTSQVAVAFFSDGASNNGAFHESLNMAAVWKLPVLFVCENNGYATSVSARRSTSVTDIGVRGAGYGIPGVTVDGNRVDRVYQAASEAVRRARAGEGPTLIECQTYRIRGHYEGGDWWEYRDSAEVEEARRRDPIAFWQAALVEDGVLGEKTLDEMNARIDSDIEDAVQFAAASPLPEPEQAFVPAHPQPA